MVQIIQITGKTALKYLGHDLDHEMKIESVRCLQG